MSLYHTVIFKGTEKPEKEGKVVVVSLSKNSVRTSITNDTTRERAYFLFRR